MKALGSKNTSLLLGLGAMLLGVGGCGLLIGTEERIEAKPLHDGPIDEETKIPTTELCVDYCDEVMGNCSLENAVYKARASCVNTCNALPPGEAAEPTENTVECRLQRAKSAGDDPDEHCVAAGPGGGTSCGSNCEAWCQLLEHECSDDFQALNDCRSSCESIEDKGGFDTEASYLKDDIQCRLIHLGAVGGLEDSAHCGHARYIAEDKCVPGAEDEPTCAVYCDAVMANCQDETATYESRDDCLAACEVFPLGDLADRGDASIGCRIYHGRSSAFDPATHCHHAGPTGDGVCASQEDGGASGNCESYCRLLEQGCAAEFSSDFENRAECIEQCSDDFEGKGAEKNSRYTVDDAREEDSLQCRVFYAVRAIGGDEDACEKARSSGSCD